MKKTKKRAKEYAHNPAYCMIRPDAKTSDDEIVTTGQS